MASSNRFDYGNLRCPLMPDVAPCRFNISRHYGSSVPPRAPHEGWAACTGRSPGLRLERLSPAFPAHPRERARADQWHSWSKLADYSCGGSPGFRTQRFLTVFPFHPRTSSMRGNQCTVIVDGSRVACQVFSAELDPLRRTMCETQDFVLRAGELRNFPRIDGEHMSIEAAHHTAVCGYHRITFDSAEPIRCSLREIGVTLTPIGPPPQRIACPCAHALWIASRQFRLQLAFPSAVAQLLQSVLDLIGAWIKSKSGSDDLHRLPRTAQRARDKASRGDLRQMSAQGHAVAVRLFDTAHIHWNIALALVSPFSVPVRLTMPDDVEGEARAHLGSVC